MPATIYFNNARDKTYPSAEKSTFEEEAEWIARNNIKTMIVTNNNKLFKEPHQGWEQIASTKSAGKNEKIFEAKIYHIPDMVE